MKLYNFLIKRLIWWWKRCFRKPIPTPTKISCAMCERPVDPFVLSDECLCIYCQSEVYRQRRTRHALMIPVFPHCPRCDLELNPGMNTQKTVDGYCPRCAYDIDNTIDISDGLADPEKVKEWKGIREFNTLVLILNNWLDGYLGVVARDGVDWSTPHEFFQEFAELMYPYIRRLKETGHATPDRLDLIGDKVTSACQIIINACQQEEDLMRLCGEWTDKEQEIKEYWENVTETRGRMVASFKEQSQESTPQIRQEET